MSSGAKSEQNAKAATVIIGAQIFIATIILSALLRGLTLSILWGWFIERLGVDGINVGEAIGIAIVVGFLFPNKNEPQKQGLGETFGLTLISCALALFLGWIVHLFL